jgi:hypothetical protein
VEKLWKSGEFIECKFGDLLRIWHFAQDFVNRPAAGRKIFYLIYFQLFISLGRSALIGSAREL